MESRRWTVRQTYRENSLTLSDQLTQVNAVRPAFENVRTSSA
jgi:hypothetical protein